MTYPLPFITQQSQSRVPRPFIQGFSTEAIQCATESPAYAGPNLSKWFRTQRKLGSRDRRIVSEIVYTLIRFEDWFVQAKLLTEPLHTDSDLQNVFEWMHTPSITPQFDLATHLSVPKDLLDTIGDIPQPTVFAEHHQKRAPIDIRCNPLRMSRSRLLQKLKHRGIEGHPIPNTSHGIRIVGTANIIGEPLFNQGAFEVQDAASQYFIESLSPFITPQTTVLDYCAGAGGKSLALAALGAKVYAHDPRSKAIEQLVKRAKRANLPIQVGMPNKPVDMVIVDAPCSGSGRLRREPTVRWKWTAQPPLDWVPVQSEILQSASQFVQRNGLIAYATCSILPQENQHTLQGWKPTRNTIFGHESNCDGFSWTLFQSEDRP